MKSSEEEFNTKRINRNEIERILKTWCKGHKMCDRYKKSRRKKTFAIGRFMKMNKMTGTNANLCLI